ncbi:AtpZ/AtpI family protein [Alkaliphilus sp. MSJ-5]|uniref:AtpZ/AtpI family protein n=1 Tax=Alkaliphilus flagellatus TaxID=2841507 RepID=A0ABS6G5E5_9FIRM|nr:AtpZ/AtpI family protein [Alkaliphilus flagellatus]MBU5676591.1 AtpZ/AtpI family protein [Alkaliphilus flagellatus]
MARKTSALENLVLISQIGISMMVPIGIGLYIGKWLDDRLETGPIFLFIFIIIGVVSAFMSLFKITQSSSESKKRK